MVLESKLVLRHKLSLLLELVLRTKVGLELVLVLARQLLDELLAAVEELLSRLENLLTRLEQTLAARTKLGCGGLHQGAPFTQLGLSKSCSNSIFINVCHLDKLVGIRLELVKTTLCRLSNLTSLQFWSKHSFTRCWRYLLTKLTVHSGNHQVLCGPHCLAYHLLRKLYMTTCSILEFESTAPGGTGTGQTC